jgi:hypothetical protein
MNKTLRFGLAFVLIGVAVVMIVGIMTQDNFFTVDEGMFTSYSDTYTKDEISKFDFNFDNRKIYVLPSDNDDIHVEYYLYEKETFSSSVDNGTLRMKIDLRWYYNFFNFYNLTNPGYYVVNLYLPTSILDYSLDLATSNGNISLSGIPELQDVELSTSNGDIIINQLDANMIDLSTSNGKIELSDVISTTNINGKTSNGRIILDNVKGVDLDFGTSNGRITADLIECENLELSSSNGEVNVEVIGTNDDYKIRLATSNGDRVLNDIKVDQNNFNTDKSNYINIESSNGDVELKFTLD